MHDVLQFILGVGGIGKWIWSEVRNSEMFVTFTIERRVTKN